MSDIVPKFYGKIDAHSGVVKLLRPGVYGAYLRSLLGQQIELVVRKKQNPKTMPQLAYFHGVICRLCSEASGYTDEEVKGLLKGQFLTKYVIGPTGQEIPIVASLADLKKDEMGSFIDKCIRLAAEHWSCVIPSPDECQWT